MSEVSTRELFRLKRCPECEYSFESLPAVGVCPECGRAYDDRFIVLEDDTGSETEPPSRKRRRLIFSGIAAVFSLIWLQYVIRRREWVFAMWMLPTIATCAVIAWRYLVSSARGHAQLWICEKGFEQIQSNEEARAADRRVQWLNRWGQLIAFALIAAMFWGQAEAYSFACVAFFFGSVTLLMWLGRRRSDDRVVVVGGDHSRSLIPWWQVDRCEVTQPSPGRIRVRLRRTFKTFLGLSERDEARVDAPCTEDEFKLLATQIHTWAGM